MGGKGCTRTGICGKNQELADLQDRLILDTKILCAAATQLRREKTDIPENVNALVRRNLCAAMTNANFDSEAIGSMIRETQEMCGEWAARVAKKEVLPEKDAFLGVLSTEDEDMRSFRELITYIVKGIASAAASAANLGKTDTDIDIFMQRALSQTIDDKMTGGNYFAIVMESGRYSVRVMDLLARAKREAFGVPKQTEVSCTGEGRPGILVTGSDFRDLQLLLEQTKDKEIDIYTHGEMLSAHAYPQLRAYTHLKGQYGGSWQTQKEDFEQFRGPVLATSEGVFLPKNSYKDRLFTTNYAGIPGCTHIGEKDGQKDFSALIELARKAEAPKPADVPTRMTGFGHEELFSQAEAVSAMIREGKISRLAIVAGDDGRAKIRTYYTDLIKVMPDDAKVLTAGSVQYRFPAQEAAGSPEADIDSKEAAGDSGSEAAVREAASDAAAQDGTDPKCPGGDLPYVISAGGAEDLYSLIQFLLQLRETADVDSLNQLPLYFSYSWYGEKSTALLMSLLYLDIRHIHLGPTWPAFISGNVRIVLQDYFKLQGITTVQADLEQAFGASEDLVRADMIIGDVVEQYPSLVPVMAGFGLHCIGCGVSKMETMEEACRTHGLNVYDLLEKLNEELKIRS